MSRSDDAPSVPERGLVTALSVIGSSGQPFLKDTLKALAPARYRGKVRDADGVKVKVAGHLRYCSENVELLEAHHPRACVIFRDPRDVFLQLVRRSHLDFCPEKFERPRTHPDAVEFHRLVKRVADHQGDQGMVEYFLETAGGLELFRKIHAVVAWRHQSWVLPVRFEDLAAGSDDTRRSTIEEIADFIGAPTSGVPLDDLLARIERRMDRRRSLPLFGVGWEQTFSDSDRTLFKDLFGHDLIDLGYEGDLDW